MQSIVIEQRRPGLAVADHCCDCVEPGEDPQWEVIVRELPPPLTSIVLMDCRVIVTTPANIALYVERHIANAQTRITV